MTEPADEYGDLDETKVFQVLDDHGVEYVVIGGALRLCGVPDVRPATSTA